MTREAELLYKIIQWDESILQPAGKMAAGPLFDIKCCEDAVRQLHFPHCETQEGEQIIFDSDAHNNHPLTPETCCMSAFVMLTGSCWEVT